MWVELSSKVERNNTGTIELQRIVELFQPEKTQGIWYTLEKSDNFPKILEKSGNFRQYFIHYLFDDFLKIEIYSLNVNLHYLNL